MKPENPIISLQKVLLSYGKGKAKNLLAQNLNLTATESQLIALGGTNGIGKSTLLRTIAGLQKLQTGSIELFGQSIKSLHAKALARYVSVVLTGQEEISYVKASELVAMGRLPHTGWLGNFSPTDYEKVQAATEQARVTHLLEKPIYQLSDGERQKVMIAKALAQDTPIMILDEPTTHLDIANRVSIVQLLRTLVRDHNKCIIFSTHDIELALQVANRIWLMHDQTVSDNVPEDLVLSGTLSNAMGSELAGFHPESGTFRIKQPAKRFISLEGSGTTAQWTQRALERVGYQVQPDHSIVIEIFSDSEWIIYQEGQIICIAHSIEHLLDELARIDSPFFLPSSEYVGNKK